jgi:toxin secretion/phage lysis holin
VIKVKRKGRRRMGKFPTLTALIGTPLAFLFGEWTPLLSALLLFTALDLVTGFIKAWINRTIISREMYKGIGRKALMWVVLIVANQVDIIMFDGMPIAKTGVATFFLGMEGISILENIGQSGVTLPSWLAKYFERLKDDGSQAPTLEQTVDEIKVKVHNQEVKLKTKDDLERVD